MTCNDVGTTQNCGAGAGCNPCEFCVGGGGHCARDKSQKCHTGGLASHTVTGIASVMSQVIAAGEQRSVQARRTFAEVADCVQCWRNRRQHTPAPPRLVLEGGRWRLSGCRGGGSVVSDIPSFDCRGGERFVKSGCSVASVSRQSLLQSLCGVGQQKKKGRVRPECKVNARGTPALPALVLTTGCHACRAVQPRNAHARCPPPTPGVRHHRLPWTAQARGTHTRGAGS